MTTTPANAGLTDRILALLAASPEQGFRPAEVAVIVGPPDVSRQQRTQVVGTCLAKLARKGRVSVVRSTVEGQARPVPSYGHLPTS